MSKLQNILNFLRQDIGIHKYSWLDTFYNKIIEEKPQKVIEFGTKAGLTTITIALALKEIEENGKIVSYDCFDQQVKERISDVISIDQVLNNIKKWNCQDIIEVKKMDFFDWIKDPQQFDLMYLDIDNDGDKIQQLSDAVYDQLLRGSIIVFEGGSIERDNVPWMLSKNKKQMNLVKDYVKYKVIDERFPSLSMIKL
jgi:predicted O-methyltransferase YrrM